VCAHVQHPALDATFSLVLGHTQKSLSTQYDTDNLHMGGGGADTDNYHGHLDAKSPTIFSTTMPL